ncbi:hypothetical protein P280DRAFT_196983 [Massarina eburnea CBS 473.64]|uniref:DUF7730 domain-containing protein n=1 Tax=Massarina eburnea CBS 473.64 TaxID=1395130 RepID=A0A6A6RJI3_9PLEO|nr:hypothetical protein P280DRAFT_196983 [Massarina eburnea CBS 473.64]
MQDPKASATNMHQETTTFSDEIRLVISLRNQQKSALLSLPAEVRIMIYKYVLGGSPLHAQSPFRHLPLRTRLRAYRPRFTWNRDLRLSEREKEYKATPHKTAGALNLLQVCRQIHAEARLIPFALNTIVFHPCPTRIWLDGRDPEQLKAITSIQIEHLYKLGTRSMLETGLDFQELPALEKIHVNFSAPNGIERAESMNEAVILKDMIERLNRGIKLTAWGIGINPISWENAVLKDLHGFL